MDGPNNESNRIEVNQAGAGNDLDLSLAGSKNTIEVAQQSSNNRALADLNGAENEVTIRANRSQQSVIPGDHGGR